MLQQKRMIEENVWSNPQIKAFVSEDDDPGLAITLFDLVKAFGELLERAKNRPVYEVESGDVTVADMIRYLRSSSPRPARTSRSSSSGFSSEQRTRRAMVALFLAVLEMVRMQAVVVTQKDLFGEIALAAARQLRGRFRLRPAYRGHRKGLHVEHGRTGNPIRKHWRLRRADAKTTTPEREAAEPPEIHSRLEVPDGLIAAGELLRADAETGPLPPIAEDARCKAVLEAIVYVTEEPLTAAQSPPPSDSPPNGSRRCSTELVAEFDKPEHGLSIKGGGRRLQNGHQGGASRSRPQLRQEPQTAAEALPAGAGNPGRDRL